MLAEVVMLVVIVIVLILGVSTRNRQVYPSTIIDFAKNFRVPRECFADYFTKKCF